MKKILFIDDIISNHTLVARFLLKDGYEVICCDTATKSYQLLLEHHFHLVITDYGLLDETGIQIAEKLKNDLRTKLIPIILLTAGTFDIEEKIHHETFVDFIFRKPIDFPLLRKTIRQLIN